MRKRSSVVSLVPVKQSAPVPSEGPWADLSPFYQRLARQICEVLGWHDFVNDKDISPQAAAAIETVREIGPRTELEGMLAVQMVVAHHATMTYFQHGARPGEPAAVQEAHHRRGQHQMTLFLQQLEALDRHRSRNKPSGPEGATWSPEQHLAHLAEIEELLNEHLNPLENQPVYPD
ncbi:hypothetical protein ACETIH_02645 [Microvirga arabica]|uniref:Uncharacterized protein n=1 Tax=Microvirga arabica TaxID=1128671 RepID=A0ABV6Y2X8_9HYPH